jgi:hypothetical protein
LKMPPLLPLSVIVAIAIFRQEFTVNERYL